MKRYPSPLFADMMHVSCSQSCDTFNRFFSGLPLWAAQECAIACKSKLASSGCKFCGKGISGSSLRSPSEDEPVCVFCPDGLKRSYWDRVIPFNVIQD